METVALTELAQNVIALAHARGMRLVTAESCTAGALSTLLSDIPGAGEVLEGGFVSYSKSFKTNVLGVSAETLDRESAVCEPVAIAMARGALKNCRLADAAVAVTGICGPTSDEDGNPVGLAHIAIADRHGATSHQRLTLGDDSPGRLRGAMMAAALRLLDRFLTEYGSASSETTQ